MSSRWAHRVVVGCVIFNLIAALAVILRGGPWWIIVGELLGAAFAMLMLWSLKRLNRDIARTRSMIERAKLMIESQPPA